MKEKEIRLLEEIDEKLLLRALSAPVSTPRAILYLDLGVLPLRYVIITRRLMYLHYILNQDKKTMLSKFFFSQNAKPLKGDWCLTIQKDMKLLGLNTLSLEDIQKLKKTEFKNIIN